MGPGGTLLDLSFSEASPLNHAMVVCHTHLQPSLSENKLTNGLLVCVRRKCTWALIDNLLFLINCRKKLHSVMKIPLIW